MDLIIARCVYRLVEFALGSTTTDVTDHTELRKLSLLVRYKVFFYVFEAALVLANSALWNAWHPGRYLPHESRVHLAQEGRTEVVAEEEAHGKERQMGLTILAHCGLIVIVTKGVRAFRKRQSSRGRKARVSYADEFAQEGAQRGPAGFVTALAWVGGFYSVLENSIYKHTPLFK
ncbi:hypothetical protein PG994_003890 [Apiospora phragmitis]|uniref:Uncharacterized protein n=1 Tax=Apiospora phragmitis TaxID=2905665 RepID=A0ABR1VZI1_9PEZI